MNGSESAGYVNLYTKPWRFWVSVTDNLNQMPLWLIHINKLYVLKCSANSIKQLRVYKNAAERVAGIADSQAIAKCSGKSERKIYDRLVNGDICFISEVNGAIVGYVWMSSVTTYCEDAEGINIYTDEVTSWLYDGFVVPEFRIKGIWLNLQYALFAKLQKEGKQCAACSVDYDNINSARTHLRFAYEPTHLVMSLCVLGLAIRWVTDLDVKRTKFHVTWWRNYLDVHV